MWNLSVSVWARTASAMCLYFGLTCSRSLSTPHKAPLSLGWLTAIWYSQNIPFLATWHIAIPNTESLYISLSCYYKFHVKTKLQKYSEVFARDLNLRVSAFLGSLLSVWTSPHMLVALRECVEPYAQNGGARKRNVYIGLRGSDLRWPL